jgi:hypothetical protein
MNSFFHSVAALPTPFNMIVFIVLVASVAGVIGAIAKEVRKFLCHREEMELKREMIDRGMESEEIDRVIRAKPAGKPEPLHVPYAR